MPHGRLAPGDAPVGDVMRVRLPHRFDVAVLSNVAWVVVSAIGRTLRINTVNIAEPDRRLAAGEGQLLVTWHGRTLLPLIYFRKKRVVSIVSPSRDGEIQYRLHRRFGWDAVRGSSGRDATRAVLGAVRRLRAGETIAVAPDGPRGPAGIVQPGTLFLAMKSGCPIMPAGVSASSAWVINSWDRFLIPKPGSRTALVFGDPIIPPVDADEDWMREMAPLLQATLNELQARADSLTGYRDSTPLARAT